MLDEPISAILRKKTPAKITVMIDAAYHGDTNTRKGALYVVLLVRVAHKIGCLLAISSELVTFPSDLHPLLGRVTRLS